MTVQQVNLQNIDDVVNALIQPQQAPVPPMAPGVQLVSKQAVEEAVRTLALAPTDVNITEEIDTYLAGFKPQGFRGEEASPVILVEKDSDQFRTFNANNAFRQVNVLSSLQSAVNEVDPETFMSTYLVQERALGAFVPAVTEAQAAPLYDPRMAASRRIRWALDLDKEIRIFGTGGLLSTSGNWNANNFETLLAGAEWNATTGNPITDLQNRIVASNQPVTDIYMNTEVGFTFLNNQNVRDHIRNMLGDQPLNTGAQQATGVAQEVHDFQIPGMPPIHIVPMKVLNESTGLLDFVLTDSVILTRSVAVPVDGMDINTTQTFRRRGPSGTGFETREFEEPNRGLGGGSKMVSGHAEDVVMTANTVGGLILDIIQ